MKDALGALYREFGTPLLAPFKVGVGEITATLAGWKDKAREWGQTVANVLQGAIAILQNGDAGKTFGAALQLGVAAAVNTLYRGAMATVGTLIEGFSQAAGVLIKALASGDVWKTLADGMNFVGGKLAASIMRAIADALANVTGMQGVALQLNTAANRANKDANQSQEAVQEDLKKTDVRKAGADASQAFQKTGDVWKNTYADTKGPMDEEKPKADLAGYLQKANVRNKLTDANATPQSLTDAFTTMHRGKATADPVADPADAPSALGVNPTADPNAKPPDPDHDNEVALGFNPTGAKNWQVEEANRINGTRPIAPKLTIPNLNASAQSFVGGGGSTPKPDPQIGQTNKMLEQILAFMRDNRPQRNPAGATF